MSTHSPYLKILNEGEGRKTKENILPSSLLVPLILFTLKMRGERREEKDF